MSARAASLRPSVAAPEVPVPVDAPAAAPVAKPVASRAWIRVVAVTPLLAALAALAAAGAYLVLRDDATAPARASAQPAELGAMSVQVPADWVRADAADSGLSGLPVDAVVFAPTPGLSAHAVVLLVPDTLPAPLRRLEADQSGGRTTTLAGYSARIFAARPIGGDRTAQLTLARTGAGTLAVACVGRDAVWIGAAGCAQQVRPGRSD